MNKNEKSSNYNLIRSQDLPQSHQVRVLPSFFNSTLNNLFSVRAHARSGSRVGFGEIVARRRFLFPFFDSGDNSHEFFVVPKGPNQI